jgi:hypothetical protein
MWSFRPQGRPLLLESPIAVEFLSTEQTTATGPAHQAE